MNELAQQTFLIFGDTYSFNPTCLNSVHKDKNDKYKQINYIRLISYGTSKQITSFTESLCLVLHIRLPAAFRVKPPVVFLQSSHPVNPGLSEE